MPGWQSHERATPSLSKKYRHFRITRSDKLMEMDALSIDQFVIFVAIVDEGGFAAAARRLNRAQSAITYAIQKLEDQSGLQLFDRSGYRPSLTDAGSALLPRARRILQDIADYRHQARGIAEGLEAELC